MIEHDLNSDRSLALETAWQRYAQLKTQAAITYRQYLSLRGGAILLSAIATFLAVAIASVDRTVITAPPGRLLIISLVLVPIINVIVLAISRNPQQGQYWQILNAGAEETRKTIYLYRTLLPGQENRHQWLNERVSAIQRQVFDSLGGDLVLQPYTGNLPPDEGGEQATRDPGFSDLLPPDYLHYRLDAQLQQYTQELAQLNTTRRRLQIALFSFAGLSALLPVLGVNVGIWVAFTLFLATAFTLWLEVGRIDDRVNANNQLILALNMIRDRWQSFTAAERTGEEFFQLVLATENALWNYYRQPMAERRQVVTPSLEPSDDLLTEALKHPTPKLIEPVPEAAEDKKVETIAVAAKSTQETVTLDIVQKVEKPAQTPQKKGLPHAFVVMPFGRKKAPDGRWIDFNSIYQTLIKPALEEAGFESFRADEESVSGDIITDMFQELLLADLVLTDLSIDNANVFYELGVRHALRKRGLVHIQCGRAYMPYDIFNVRTLPYHCDESGCPDPNYLEKDKQAIVKIARATWESDKNRIHSPIFNVLTGLDEPDRKSLQTPLATGYWQEYKEWQERVVIAQRQKRIGDVLLLTEEVSNPLIKEEALAEAGKALKNLGNHALALQEYRQGLKINSDNSEFRKEEAFHLSRLKQFDEAIVKLESLLQDEPKNIDALCYLARIYKEMWRNEWQDIPDQSERLNAAYDAAHLLKKAVDTYLKAYRLDHNHYYSGINALTLLAVLDHLVQHCDVDSDAEGEALRQQLPNLQGAVHFCLESAVKHNENDAWAYVSLGDLMVLAAQTPKQVTRAYKKALTLLWNNKFALEATLDQLQLLAALSFRPKYVQAGQVVIQGELERLNNETAMIADESEPEPTQVILFSGHMIDSPTREQPRFPAAMEHEARRKIEETLDKLNPSTNCLAIAPGAACGGDILFIEACLKRNVKVEVFLPFAPAQFIAESVSFAGDNWTSRFYTIQNHPNVSFHLQPERLGDVPIGDNAFQRNNRWALYSTLMYGIDRVRLIVLWNGKGGDAPGGTGDMVHQVRHLGGVVEHIDTTKFDYWNTRTEVLAR
ncbi:MAG: TRAFs-binding domain-containing protein [Coleofasciculus sp. C1-SOL-03]|uniref:TRAFs-binding domain-containing protein n=1 Tax=Coleofasciculus sp. C1-SOL-03 TaxID=3069522 RepID=UPI0032FEFF83